VDHTCLVVPVLPGKEDDVRAFYEEVEARKEEFDESEQRLGQEGGEHSEDRHREACSGDDDGGEPARRVRPEQLAARGVPRDEPCPHGREAHVEHLAGERRNRDRERAKQRGEEQGVKGGKVHGGGRAGQIRVDVPESMPEGPP